MSDGTRVQLLPDLDQITSETFHDDRERAYYLARAETELDCAQQACHPAAAQAHYQLAGAYLERVYRQQR